MRIPFLDYAKGKVAEDVSIKAPPAKMLKEQAWSNETFFGRHGGVFEAYNPDALVARKGYRIYREMLRDPQVKSAFNLVLDIITSRDFRFEIDNDNPLHAEQAEFFLNNINITLRGTWKQALRQILMAKAYGFSVSEKTFIAKESNGKTRWCLHTLCGKPFETFTFDVDHFGAVQKIYQNQQGQRQELDPRKFILYVQFPELDPVWGESDLRSAYRSWWEKDIIQKFWNIYLERLAGGFVVVKAKENAPVLSTAERSDFQNVLSNLSQGTSIMLPAGFDMDVIAGASTEAFERAIAHKDKEIAKSLMIPNLLGFSEQGDIGSYAQSQTQFETFMLVITQGGDRLADTLNEQLFRDLSIWNFGTEDFPRYVFEPLTTEQKRLIAEAWGKAVKDGVVTNTFDDEQRTRELLKYDPRMEEEEKEEPAQPPEKEDIAKPDEKENYSDRSRRIQMQDDNPQKFINRVDFADISDFFDEAETDFVKRLGEIVDIAVRDLMIVMRDAMIDLQNNNADESKVLTLLESGIVPDTKAKINRIAREILQTGYDEGRTDAQREIDRAADEAPLEMRDRIRMAARLAKRLAIRGKFGTDIEWSVLNFVEGVGLDTAEKYFASRAFWITGLLNDDLVQAAKNTILNGIKNQLTMEEIEKEMLDLLQPLIGQIDPKTGTINKDIRPQLGTIVETNLSDAYNQSILAVYTDPDLGDFVEAMMYSAILDRRTTPFCREWDGKIFPRKDEVWKSITPPNHFRCRSRLIAVTAVDEWSESKKGLTTPEKGFGRTITKPTGEPVLSRQ